MGQKQSDPVSVGGTHMFPVYPECLKARLCWAIEEAERLSGGIPVTNPEIAVVYTIKYGRWMFTRGMVFV